MTVKVGLEKPKEHPLLGVVAQLGERCVRNAEVEGSNPFSSTYKLSVLNRYLA